MHDPTQPAEDSEDPRREADPEPADTQDGSDRTLSYHPQTPDAGTTLPGEAAAADGTEILAGGRYTIVSEIDRGGMGVVYRAIDTDVQRPLAVKVLLERDVPGGLREERFLAEARITGQLQHPGIAPVHEIGRLADGRPFFAMKLIAGRTLAELLNERSSPADDLPRFLKIFEQIAQTLAYAHSQGIIHRDLKPSNVMVGAFGEVQVMDWGLARRLTEPEPSSPPMEKSSHGADFGDAETLPVGSFTTPADRLTRQGQVLGTPAYMPPEQARGQIESLDERSDVFGLGAILCTILTGRAPYKRSEGQSPLEQASRGDLSYAFSRLRICGADAELLDLARQCLAPEAADRPADAGAVAGRVSGYLNSVQERLRQAAIDRAAAEAKASEEHKRRRVGMALLTSLVLLVATVGAAAAWYLNERVVTEARNSRAIGDITTSLNDAERIRKELLSTLRDPKRAFTLLDRPGSWQGRLDAAISSIRRAESLVRQAEVDPGLAERIVALKRQLRTDLAEQEFAVELENIRLEANSLKDGKYHPSRSAAAYQAAFQRAELPVLTGDPAVLTRQTSQSSIRLFLVAAMDSWAAVALDSAVSQRVLETARRVDPDPWRDQARNLANWSKGAALLDLADRCDVEQQSPPILFLLATQMDFASVDPVPFLRRVQRRYPSDFWVNYALGGFARDPHDAVAYYRAALAVRPGSAVVLTNLGNALSRQGNVDDALLTYRQAITLDPKCALAYYNLGAKLYSRRDLDGAIAAYRQTLAIDPKLAPAQNNLGIALEAKGDLNGAIAAYRQALAIDSKYAMAYNNLGVALHNKGDFPGAIAVYRQAIEIDSKYALAHNNLGVALSGAGDPQGAAAAYRQAIAINPKYARAYDNLGFVLRRQGKFEESLRAFQRGDELGSKPKLGPNSPSVRVTRAQRLVELDRKLPAIRSGKMAPADVGERLEFAKVLYYKANYVEAVRFYADAFQAEPKRAGDLRAGHRDAAVRAAALAIAEFGVKKLSDDERNVWSSQARAWLRADLEARTKVLEQGPKSASSIKKKLRQWQTDPDLAGVRDQAALARLSADERAAWGKLWADVAAVIKRIEEMEP